MTRFKWGKSGRREASYNLDKSDQLVDLEMSPESSKSKGLTIWTAALFLVGDVGGSGVLAFPLALNDTGVIGVLIMLACTCTSAYTATLLGRCWTLVRHRYAEYKDQPRLPYPAMGKIAFGTAFKKFVSFCVNFTSFGSCVAFLIVSSQNLKDLASDAHMDMGHWLLIAAAILCPVCWLGTPKDFWPIALTATLATTVACIFMIIQMVRDAQSLPPAFHGPIRLKSFLMAVGTLCFGFGGHQVFPTIQVDMKKPEDFGFSVSIAFTIVFFMYFPVSIAGYLLYGHNLDANVLTSILPGPLLTAAQVLITLHLLTGFVILINTVFQEMEDLLQVPNCFCVRRIVLRTVIVGLVLFTALTVPQFGAILALVGGSTMTALEYVLPALLYLKLTSMKGDWDTVELQLYEKVACVEIITVGTLVGVAATFSALEALTYSHFTKPCYLS